MRKFSAKQHESGTTKGASGESLDRNRLWLSRWPYVEIVRLCASRAEG